MEKLTPEGQTRARGSYPIMSFTGLENSHSIFKKNAKIVITERGIEIFRLETSERKGYFPWVALSGISSSDGAINLKFASRHFTIQSEKSMAALLTIQRTLMQILAPNEIMNLNPPIPSYIPKEIQSDVSAFLRLQLMAESKSFPLTDSFVQKLSDIFTFSAPKVEVAALSNSETFLSMFIDCAQFSKSIESLSFESRDICKFLEKNPLRSSTVKFIQLRGEVSDCLPSVLGGIPSLCGLAFSNSSMDASQLTHISEVAIKRGITTLGFHSAIAKSSYPFLINNFLALPFKCLTYLSFDGTQNIDIEEIIVHAPYIKALSVADCKLQLPQVFEAIKRAQPNNIQAINVAGNYCEKPLDEHCCMPSHIHASRVRWSGGCLQKFIRNAMQSSKRPLFIGLSLGVSDFKIDWGSQNCRNLHSFEWGSNPVGNDLIRFLSCNKEIETISFDCCTFSNAEGIELSKLISSLPNLKFFSVRGSNAVENIGFSVVQAAISNDSVQYFDISGRSSIVNEISKIVELIKERTSKFTFIFDNLHPMDSLQYLQSVSDMLDLKNLVKVSFPSNDIKELIEQQNITREQFSDLIEKFKEPHPMIPDLPSDCPFNRPFHIFFSHQKEEFPDFYTEEQIRLLGDEKSRLIPKKDTKMAPHLVPMNSLQKEVITSPIDKVAEIRAPSDAPQHRHRHLVETAPIQTEKPNEIFKVQVRKREIKQNRRREQPIVEQKEAAPIRAEKPSAIAHRKRSESTTKAPEISVNTEKKVASSKRRAHSVSGVRPRSLDRPLFVIALDDEQPKEPAKLAHEDGASAKSLFVSVPKLEEPPRYPRRRKIL